MGQSSKSDRARPRESEKACRELMESSPDGIVWFQADGTIMDANSSFCQMLGYPENELEGLSMEGITPKKWHESEKKILSDQVMTRGFSEVYEKECRRKDGTVFPVEIRTCLSHGENNQPSSLWAHVRDISERKKNEWKLTACLESLEELVSRRNLELEMKNKELEAFTHSVSHDLKAPLRGIDGYSRLLIEDHGDNLDEEGLEFLNNIRSAAEQMNRLIDALSSYSRMERANLRITDVDVGICLESVINELSHDIEAKKARIEIRPGFSTLCADYDNLRRILLIFIDNALKFAKDEQVPRIEVGWEEISDAWRLYVKDDGIGFDMKYQERIFEIFQRLYRVEKYPGTGVGLAMARKLVMRMNGRIWAESTPGSGAAFYVQLPKIANKPADK